MAIPNPGGHGFLVAEASGITGISDGSVITSWPDQLGSLTGLPRSGASAYAPTFRANGFGSGVPGVQFQNGSTGSQNIWVDWGSGSQLNSQGSLPSYTAIAVVKTSDSVPDETGDWLLAQRQTPNPAVDGIAIGITSFTDYSGTPRAGCPINQNHSPSSSAEFVYGPNPINDGAAHILTYYYDTDSGTQTIKVDGAIVMRLTGVSPNSVNTGTDLQTGPGQAGTSDLMVGALYIGTAALVTSDVHAIETYLGAVYGVTLHPDDFLEATTWDRFNIGHTQARVAWHAATGGLSAVTYNLYRSTSSGFTPNSGNRIAAALSGLNYLDTGLAAGTTYYYVAEATDGTVAVLYSQASLTTVPIDAPSIVYLGDSTTDYGYPTGPPYYCSLALATAGRANGWNDEGHPGATTASYLSNYLTGAIAEAQDCQVDVFSVAFGAADSFDGNGLSAFVTPLGTIVSTLRSTFPAAILIFQEAPWNSTDHGVLVGQYTTAIGEGLDGVWLRRGNFNVEAYFAANTSELSDGLHPSDPTGMTDLGTLWAVGKSGYPGGILSALTISQGYTLTGPSTATEGVASVNFTVAVPAGTAPASSVTVTPGDGSAGGTFTPSSVTLTGSGATATVTYTGATVGNVTISVTNSGGLIDPAALIVNVIAPLTAGSISLTATGSMTLGLTCAAATGGSGSIDYQWYRSTTSGFTPGSGNAISGATGLTLADLGLFPGTTYYYRVVATDGIGDTAETAEFSAQTTVPDPTWAAPLELALPSGKPDFRLKANDRLPLFRAQIVDASGAGIDLTAVASATLVVQSAGGERVIDAAMEIDTAHSTVTYGWQSGDTATSGQYGAEVRLTYADGRQATAPGDGNLSVLISAEAGG